MKCISLIFAEDVQRDDVEQLKAVSGCLGVSAYRNTVNMYFRRFDTPSIRSLATVLQRQVVVTGTTVELTSATIDSSATTSFIVAAIREELTV